MNKNKGITLIALVITIIVMLILVGVTINLSLNGGLFGYAKQAAKETEKVRDQELQLADGLINGQTIDDIVGTVVNDDWYGITEEMEVQEGVTEYHITSCAELKKFANAVNAGNDFAGKTVYLDKNLDLQGNESKQWTPIGINSYFNGTFDGKNHYINGIYIYTENMDSYGLFGSIRDLAIIKNLEVEGYIEAAGVNLGGIVACGKGVIENCCNKISIKCLDSWDDAGVGGIAGFFSGTIRCCVNQGNLESYGMMIGGIVGFSNNNSIYNCYNEGNITDVISGGGLVGYGEDTEIKNCYNLGFR